MRIQVVGLAACLLAATYTANAGYAWAEHGDVKAPAPHTVSFAWTRHQHQHAQKTSFAWTRHAKTQQASFAWTRREHAGLVKTSFAWTR